VQSLGLEHHPDQGKAKEMNQEASDNPVGATPAPGAHKRPFFKIFGIEVRVHSSLILLLAYLIFVTALQLPMIARDAGIDPSLLSLGPLPWAVILAFSLLLSVLVHELGHTLTAKSMGLKVRSITLMMLGGISMIDKIPDRPASELLLAIAGPLVSFGIYALGHLVTLATDSPNLYLFAYWLSRTNLILGVFNLLPAFPLDGGRALRALLAIRFGISRATRISVSISNVFAGLMGILGLMTFNIFLILVAFFIYAGAQNEGLFERSRDRLRGVLAGSVAIRVPPVQEFQTVAEVAAAMVRSHQDILPVKTTDNTPALIMIERILQLPQELWRQTTVREVMETFQRSVTPAEPLNALFEQLATSRTGALPLTENNEPVGVLRMTDLPQAAALKNLQDLLKDSSHEAGTTPEPPDRGKKAA
jgi:Zn-dependent protease